MTPDFTPAPVPTGSLSCFRGNGQVEGRLRLVPGPPKRPQKGGSASSPPQFVVLESVWAGHRGLACRVLSWLLSLRTSGFCSGRPRECVPGGQPAIPLCWALLPLKSPLVFPARPWLLQEPPVGNPSPLPLYSIAPGWA